MSLFSKKPVPPLPGGLKPDCDNFSTCLSYTKGIIELIHLQQKLLVKDIPVANLRWRHKVLAGDLRGRIIEETHFCDMRRRNPGEPWLNGIFECWETFEKLEKEECFANGYGYPDEAIERKYLYMHVPIYERLVPLLERLVNEIGVWKFGGEAEWAAHSKHVDDKQWPMGVAFEEKFVRDRFLQDMRQRVRVKRAMGLLSDMLENREEGDDQDHEEKEEMQEMKAAVQEWHLLG